MHGHIDYVVSLVLHTCLGGPACSFVFLLSFSFALTRLYGCVYVAYMFSGMNLH